MVVFCSASGGDWLPSQQETLTPLRSSVKFTAAVDAVITVMEPTRPTCVTVNWNGWSPTVLFQSPTERLRAMFWPRIDQWCVWAWIVHVTITFIPGHTAFWLCCTSQWPQCPVMGKHKMYACDWMVSCSTEIINLVTKQTNTLYYITA